MGSAVRSIPIIGPVLSPKMPKLPAGPDAELLERERAAEAMAQQERQRLISGKQMGYMSTILTGGTGVEEEANVGKTLLGGR
tara:strand:- start:1836 stop:2081 length:246 start_codon:yes stop_codon:yes gene_type:complete